MSKISKLILSCIISLTCIIGLSNEAYAKGKITTYAISHPVKIVNDPVSNAGTVIWTITFSYNETTNKISTYNYSYKQNFSSANFTYMVLRDSIKFEPGLGVNCAHGSKVKVSYRIFTALGVPNINCAFEVIVP